MESQGREQLGGLRERFYQSVAEALTLLHPAPDCDRRKTLLEVARALASTMDLPLVWIGRRELGQSRLQISAAGAQATYGISLRISDDERDPGGRGPAGIVLRDGRARLTSVNAAEHVPAREAALQHRLDSIMVAASGTTDGGQLALAFYSRQGGPALSDDLLDWAQRLVDEMARFWDDQALFERNQRLGRYREAHRTIQRAMLGQPDPVAIYDVLAQTLVEMAEAAAVIVYVPRGEKLHRIVHVGPVADAIAALPEPPAHAEGGALPTPTLTYTQGVPSMRLRPSTHPDTSPAWRSGVLADIGVIGCWPIFSVWAAQTQPLRRPTAVLLLATMEVEDFDADMRQLLDEIVDTIGLALRQYGHQQALLQEQDRQTFLALHDTLTGLPNRRALDYHLERALARAARHHRLLAVGMLDLDDLKPINDRYGHAAGDRVLIELAERLQRALRSEDAVARVGGDEFVLIFEDLTGVDDLPALLERLSQALAEPVVIGDTSVQLGVSLGIALYPTHASADGEQLLRLADQAMYQVKSHKPQRSAWWAIAQPELASAAAGVDRARVISPHGEDSVALLQRWAGAGPSRLPDLVECFWVTIRRHPDIATMLDGLPSAADALFKVRLLRRLRTLMRPQLVSDRHRAGAVRAGAELAASGMQEVWLIDAVEALRATFIDVFARDARAGEPVLSVALQRLTLERQWLLDGLRDLQRRRELTLAKMLTLAWSADDYVSLLERALATLAGHDEIALCTAGRVDGSGVMVHEWAAGRVAADAMRISNAGTMQPVLVDSGDPGHDEPIARAWRTGQIQRCAHYASDPSVARWRDTARRHRILSFVAIPLCPSAHKPLTMLVLYSAHAGGFRSRTQQLFVEQLKATLELALLRLLPRGRLAALLPAFVRERWRALLGGGALRMHYQPMIRLSDGRAAGFEALARVRDDLGTLQLPASFMPALGGTGLMRLFRDGMIQAVACRQSLARAGVVLGMSVNVPVEALQNLRYAQTADTIMRVSGCPVGALRFEAIDAAAGAGCWSLLAQSGVQSFTSLEVHAFGQEVELSRGLLARLCQLPFDRIKADPAVMAQVRQDPLGTLRFLRQLIRAGHDLGLEVVIEGLESPGMVEAAILLGADFGQGFALARPMPAEALGAWLASFELTTTHMLPHTSLGVLARALRWDERFADLFDETRARDRHVQTAGFADAWLHDHPEAAPALRACAEAMFTAASSGPFDSDYGRLRDQFFSLLVEQALADEQRCAMDVVRGA